MSVGSGKNQKEIESLCAVGENEEVHCYLVLLWKETTEDGHRRRTVGRHKSAIDELAHELRQASLTAQ
jgi:hypothetical protein